MNMYILKVNVVHLKRKVLFFFFLLLLLFYPFCSTIDVDQDNNTDSREAN